MSYIKQLSEVLGSPCYNYALKEVLSTFDKRDCLDAMRDAQVLLSLCQLRFNEVENQANALVSLFEGVRV